MPIASNTVNSLAVTVLPDAPTDPVTGLKVPTIAVATAAGISVIQSSGTVRNSSSTSAFTQVTLTPKLLSAGRADAVWYYAQNPGSLGASFALSTQNASTATDFNVGTTALLKTKDRANYARSSGTLVNLLKNNEGTIGKGVAAKITDTYNAGWLLGDIRRAYLADIGEGSVTGPELVTNGTFDTDTTGWALVGTGALSVESYSGSNRLKIVSASFYGTTDQQIPTVAGRTYILKGEVAGDGVNYGILFGGSVANGSEYTGVLQTTSTTPQSFSKVFTATGGVLYIRSRSSALSGGTVYLDNISVKEVTADRSYKAATSSIYGTLTKTAVASNTDLVAYSGFSATNYLQEPYSADLDFGTGEWSVGAWVNVPTANSSAAKIAARAYSSGPYITLGIDATNKLTATAYDGTTTRTVTTTAAYNTATWLKAEAEYTTDGALAIRVNGQKVATTTGTPLLTLNNSDAALTIGNSYALDAPFPGSIALLKLSATVPTTEQAQWMYEQEKQLFRDGAKCVLPASTGILDLAYDDATDTWSALQATYESTWSGLVRTSTQAPSAGSFSKVFANSGIKLLGRTTTNPGVDVQIPAKNLRTKDMPKDTNQDIVVFDFDAVTSQTDFALPVGYTARVVYSAGSQKREGSTKDWQSKFDGFRETVQFSVAPGNGAWVQIHAVKTNA